MNKLKIKWQFPCLYVGSICVAEVIQSHWKVDLYRAETKFKTNVVFGYWTDLDTTKKECEDIAEDFIKQLTKE